MNPMNERSAEEAAALARIKELTDERIKELAKEEIYELFGVKDSDIPGCENSTAEPS